MKTSFPRSGVLAALAIPVNARGRVMKRALAEHIEWLRGRGVHGILALGSTGEFIRFSVEERKEILELVAELAGTLPVIANVSDLRPRAASELGRFARQLHLAGVAVMPPSFYPVSATDQLAFFEHVANASGLPTMLYNFPELTGNRISIETVAAFADRCLMAGIKQSGGEFSYHTTLISMARQKGFSVFSGADTRLQEVFTLGADGCIGGLVNFVPEPMLEIYNVCHDKKPGDAMLAGERLKVVGAIIDKLNFPLNVAAGVEARGFEPGLPKTVVSPDSARRYGQIVAELRTNFKAWGFEAGPAGRKAGRTARTRSKGRSALLAAT